MLEFAAFASVLIVAILLVLVLRSMRQRRFRAQMTARFGRDMFYIAPVTGDYIGVDYRNRQVLLGTHGGRSTAAYDFEQLLAVEVVENNLVHVRLVRPPNGEGVAAAVVTPEQMPPSPPSVEPRQRTLALQVTSDDVANGFQVVRFFYGFEEGELQPWSDDQRPPFVALRLFYDHLRRAMQSSVSTRAARLAEDPTDDPGPCTVTLDSSPSKPEAVNALCSVLPNLDFAAAVKLIENLPADVLKGVTRETAEAMARELERKGMGVSIRQRGRRRW